jgi:hypothetical protein
LKVEVRTSNFAARSRRRGENAAAGAPCGDVVSSLALEPVLGAGDIPLLLNSAMSIGERALSAARRSLGINQEAESFCWTRA